MKANQQITAKHLKTDKVDIDKSEVLRYLQYKNKDIDEETNKSLNESITEIKEISELKYVYRIFNIQKENTTINFEDEFVITSNDLVKLLKDCDKVAVLAATIGLSVEKQIRYYSLTNLSKGVIFDSSGTAYIEALCDYVEAEIGELASNDNLGITYRYSPGYGDVPISHQGEILKSLNATKLIGLTASDSSILIPRKSVTAFIGLDKSKTSKTQVSSCSTCSLYGTCSFSREGGHCGK